MESDVMQLQDVGRKNVSILLADLKACRSLERGKQIHAEAVECGHVYDKYVGSALVDMYAKCGSMMDARQVFDSLKHPNVVSWNALILGYADNGQSPEALELFTKMSLAPNSVTFVAALKACTCMALNDAGKDYAERGRQIHNIATENGCNANIYVQNTLIDMYGKLGKMLEAHQVFDSMQHPSVVSWNVLIFGYADNGQGLNALQVLGRMINKGFKPNSITFVAALKGCSCTISSEEYRERGKEIHKLAIENGCLNVYVQNTLTDMFSKCGNMVEARQVFDSIKHPNLVSWNVLILGYAGIGEHHTVLDVFRKMKIGGIASNSVTYVAALKACSSLVQAEVGECTQWGKAVHNLVSENDYNSNIFVQSTLIDMYAKCRSMVDARGVFDSMEHPDAVSWNALISGYAENGQPDTALEFFMRMKTEGHVFGSVTFVAVLIACRSLAAHGQCRHMGKAIHNLAVETGCSSNVYAQSTLIGTYAKCGNMLAGRQVFDSIQHPCVASWTALILGYADNGEGVTALELFIKMRSGGHSPDFVTFLAALKACGMLGALEFGRTIHAEIIDSGNELNVSMVTGLVGFYAKCDSLIEAQSVFDIYAAKTDAITWSVLLAGFSNCGDNESVFKLFEGMQDAGLKPNSVTFVSILMCCSHAGLVDKGRKCFEAMPTKYGIIPTIEHYTCMIDGFGRSNLLDDAMAMMLRLPCSPDYVTWRTLLGICSKWKNLQLGRLAFQSMIDLNKEDPSAYVVMAQIYKSRGMLPEEKMMIKRLNSWRSRGETCWTNEMGKVHSFLVE